MKDQKGITLIALVITIIVLLILAGVSIAMLTGQNGILTRSREAQTTTIQKSNEEIVKLAVSDLLTEYYAGGAIATNITNTNNTPSTLDINAEELKNAIYRTTSDANVTDVTADSIDIAEDDGDTAVSVLKVDFAEGEDIYVLPTTGKIVTPKTT